MNVKIELYSPKIFAAQVVLVSPTPPWKDTVNNSVRAHAGDTYHDQLAQYMQCNSFRDMQVFIAYGNHAMHAGSFDNVIFVADGRRKPLNKLLYNALFAAEKKSFESLCIPYLRDDLHYERSIEDIALEMKVGIQAFARQCSTSEMQISILLPQREARKASAVLSTLLLQH